MARTGGAPTLAIGMSEIFAGATGEGLRAFFRFASEHRNLYRIVRQAEFVDEAIYRAYYDKISAGYIEGMRAAMKKGQVEKLDPEAVVHGHARDGLRRFQGLH